MYSVKTEWLKISTERDLTEIFSLGAEKGDSWVYAAMPPLFIQLY